MEHPSGKNGFKPVKDLQVSDLPKGWRCQRALKVIHDVSQRVVMIYVPFMSSKRPGNIFSSCPHYGGTGFAYYVDKDIVKVRTNLHVVYNVEEASQAIVQFFLTIPGKRHTRLIRLHASPQGFYTNVNEDYSSFSCRANKHFQKYLHVFHDVPVMWNHSFFAHDTENDNKVSIVRKNRIKNRPKITLDVSMIRNVAAEKVRATNSWSGDLGVALHEPEMEDDHLAAGRRWSECYHIPQQFARNLDGVQRDALRQADRTALPGFHDSRRRAGDEDDEESEEKTSCKPSSWDTRSNHCWTPLMEEGDYVAILSHPRGSEKCFSLGPASMYDNHLHEPQSDDTPTQANTLTVDLVKDRFRKCKNRMYRTMSTFGCSGSPVLVFRRSLRHLQIPVVDFSQHSGTCYLGNGSKLAFATCFTPSELSQTVNISKERKEYFSVIRQEGYQYGCEERRHKKFRPSSLTVESTGIMDTGFGDNTGYNYNFHKKPVIRRRIASHSCSIQEVYQSSSFLRKQLRALSMQGSLAELERENDGQFKDTAFTANNNMAIWKHSSQERESSPEFKSDDPFAHTVYIDADEKVSKRESGTSVLDSSDVFDSARTFNPDRVFDSARTFDPDRVFDSARTFDPDRVFDSDTAFDSSSLLDSTSNKASKLQTTNFDSGSEFNSTGVFNPTGVFDSASVFSSASVFESDNVFHPRLSFSTPRHSHEDEISQRNESWLDWPERTHTSSCSKSSIANTSHERSSTFLSRHENEVTPPNSAMYPVTENAPLTFSCRQGFDADFDEPFEIKSEPKLVFNCKGRLDTKFEEEVEITPEPRENRGLAVLGQKRQSYSQISPEEKSAKPKFNAPNRASVTLADEIFSTASEKMRETGNHAANGHAFQGSSSSLTKTAGGQTCSTVRSFHSVNADTQIGRTEHHCPVFETANGLASALENVFSYLPLDATQKDVLTEFAGPRSGMTQLLQSSSCDNNFDYNTSNYSDHEGRSGMTQLLQSSSCDNNFDCNTSNYSDHEGFTAALGEQLAPSASHDSLEKRISDSQQSDTGSAQTASAHSPHASSNFAIGGEPAEACISTFDSSLELKTLDFPAQNFGPSFAPYTTTTENNNSSSASSEKDQTEKQESSPTYSSMSDLDHLEKTSVHSEETSPYRQTSCSPTSCSPQTESDEPVDSTDKSFASNRSPERDERSFYLETAKANETPQHIMLLMKQFHSENIKEIPAVSQVGNCLHPGNMADHYEPLSPMLCGLFSQSEEEPLSGNASTELDKDHESFKVHSVATSSSITTKNDATPAQDNAENVTCGAVSPTETFSPVLKALNFQNRMASVKAYFDEPRMSHTFSVEHDVLAHKLADDSQLSIFSKISEASDIDDDNSFGLEVTETALDPAQKVRPPYQELQIHDMEAGNVFSPTRERISSVVTQNKVSRDVDDTQPFQTANNKVNETHEVRVDIPCLGPEYSEGNGAHERTEHIEVNGVHKGIEHIEVNGVHKGIKHNVANAVHERIDCLAKIIHERPCNSVANERGTDILCLGLDHNVAIGVGETLKDALPQQSERSEATEGHEITHTMPCLRNDYTTTFGLHGISSDIFTHQNELNRAKGILDTKGDEFASSQTDHGWTRGFGERNADRSIQDEYNLDEGVCKANDYTSPYLAKYGFVDGVHEKTPDTLNFNTHDNAYTGVSERQTDISSLHDNQNDANGDYKAELNIPSFTNENHMAFGYGGAQLSTAPVHFLKKDIYNRTCKTFSDKPYFRNERNEANEESRTKADIPSCQEEQSIANADCETKTDIVPRQNEHSNANGDSETKTDIVPRQNEHSIANGDCETKTDIVPRQNEHSIANGDSGTKTDIVPRQNEHSIDNGYCETNAQCFQNEDSIDSAMILSSTGSNCNIGHKPNISQEQTSFLGKQQTDKYLDVILTIALPESLISERNDLKSSKLAAVYRIPEKGHSDENKEHANFRPDHPIKDIPSVNSANEIEKRHAEYNPEKSYNNENEETAKVNPADSIKDVFGVSSSNEIKNTADPIKDVFDVSFSNEIKNTADPIKDFFGVSSSNEIKNTADPIKDVFGASSSNGNKNTAGLIKNVFGVSSANDIKENGQGKPKSCSIEHCLKEKCMKHFLPASIKGLTLHQLKVLASHRKKLMRRFANSETIEKTVGKSDFMSVPTTGNSKDSNSVWNSEPLSGLQQMAQRFLKMDARKFNDKRGKKKERSEFYHIESYLAEMENCLKQPVNAKGSKWPFVQPNNDSACFWPEDNPVQHNESVKSCQKVPSYPMYREARSVLHKLNNDTPVPAFLGRDQVPAYHYCRSRPHPSAYIVPVVPNIKQNSSNIRHTISSGPTQRPVLINKIGGYTQVMMMPPPVRPIHYVGLAGCRRSKTNLSCDPAFCPKKVCSKDIHYEKYISAACQKSLAKKMQRVELHHGPAAPVMDVSSDLSALSSNSLGLLSRSSHSVDPPFARCTDSSCKRNVGWQNEHKLEQSSIKDSRTLASNDRKMQSTQNATFLAENVRTVHQGPEKLWLGDITAPDITDNGIFMKTKQTEKIPSNVSTNTYCPLHSKVSTTASNESNKNNKCEKYSANKSCNSSLGHTGHSLIHSLHCAGLDSAHTSVKTENFHQNLKGEPFHAYKSTAVAKHLDSRRTLQKLPAARNISDIQNISRQNRCPVTCQQKVAAKEMAQKSWNCHQDSSLAPERARLSNDFCNVEKTGVSNVQHQSDKKRSTLAQDPQWSHKSLLTSRYTGNVNNLQTPAFFNRTGRSIYQPECATFDRSLGSSPLTCTTDNSSINSNSECVDTSIYEVDRGSEWTKTKQTGKDNWSDYTDSNHWMTLARKAWLSQAGIQVGHVQQTLTDRSANLEIESKLTGAAEGDPQERKSYAHNGHFHSKASGVATVPSLSKTFEKPVVTGNRDMEGISSAGACSFWDCAEFPSTPGIGTDQGCNESSSSKAHSRQQCITDDWERFHQRWAAVNSAQRLSDMGSRCTENKTELDPITKMAVAERFHHSPSNDFKSLSHENMVDQHKLLNYLQHGIPSIPGQFCDTMEKTNFKKADSEVPCQAVSTTGPLSLNLSFDSDDFTEQQDDFFNDLNSIVRVVLEMGVIHPSNIPDSESDEPDDNSDSDEDEEDPLSTERLTAPNAHKSERSTESNFPCCDILDDADLNELHVRQIPSTQASILEPSKYNSKDQTLGQKHAVCNFNHSSLDLAFGVRTNWNICPKSSDPCGSYVNGEHDLSMKPHKVGTPSICSHCLDDANQGACPGHGIPSLNCKEECTDDKGIRTSGFHQSFQCSKHWGPSKTLRKKCPQTKPSPNFLPRVAPSYMEKETSDHSSSSDCTDSLWENIEGDKITLNIANSWQQKACVATVDMIGLDVSSITTLQDLHIVQTLNSDKQITQTEICTDVPKLAGDHALQENSKGYTNTRRQVYVKNEKTKKRRNINRYVNKKRKSMGAGNDVLKTSPLPLKSDSSPTLPEYSTNDLCKKGYNELNTSAMSGNSPLGNDLGSVKSDRDICYVAVPVNIGVRMEKAAKWISTQTFGCPTVHFLTPNDAKTVCIQQNLHITLQIMSLSI